MKIKLPEKVSYIIKELKQQGFDAYAVGGCVRDSILGRIPNDWDITTDAKPQDVKAIFDHTIDTGIQHGTVTVMIEHEGFEVTTYRIDGEYEDSRHPKEVQFTLDLIDDLKRRDFTINAMAYNEERGLVDAFDGIGDLERGIIRCVGVPTERFSEDALRMLRGIRFGAQLGFTIEPETFLAIQTLAPTIQKISAERIQVELIKLLTSKHPEHIRLVYESGLTSYFLPEFDRMMSLEQHNPHHCYSVGEHTIHSIMQVESDKILRLTMLFHDVAKPSCITTDEDGIDHFYKHPAVGADLTKKILRRLKFDNDTIDKVSKLVAWHDDNPQLTGKAVRRAIYRVGEAQFPNLFAVKRADILAQSDYQKEEKLSYVDDYEAMYQEILAKGQCISMKMLAITGKDLIEDLGMNQGKELGEALNRCLELVLEEPEKNTKEALYEFLQG